MRFDAESNSYSGEIDAFFKEKLLSRNGTRLNQICSVSVNVRTPSIN
jgi:hypothetical protein